MKAQLKRKDLLNVLYDVRQAASTKAVLPITKNALLEAKQGRVHVTCGNLDLFLSGQCSAKVTKTGKACLPAKKLYEVLNSLQAEDVTLSGGGEAVRWTEEEPDYTQYEPGYAVPTKTVQRSKFEGKLTVEGGNAKIALDVDDPEEYPTIPQARRKGGYVKDLQAAVGKVRYAMATDDSRPVLRGVSFNRAKGSVKLAAADGFRLAVVEVEGKLKENFVVVGDAIPFVRKIANGSTNITMGKDCVQMQGNGLTLLARTNNGTFPNYSQLIPKETGSNLTVNKQELLDALKTVSAINPPRGVKLIPKAKTLTVLAETQEKEDTSEVKIGLQGKGSKIALNIQYLKDVLARVGDEVTIQADDPGDPVMVKMDKTTHVVMPLYMMWE